MLGRIAGTARRSRTLLLFSIFSVVLPVRARADAFPDTIRFDGFEPCGLQCLRPQCPGNGTTSLSGTIYAPNGMLPLPNVEVYIPNAAVAAFVDGPNAPRCDEAPSGHPLVATLTDVNGNFVLKDVPATTGVPVVVVAGKWRRQLTVDVPACTNTPLDVAKTRLPKDHTEGDIAHIAVVTGSADALECLVRKTGVVDSEFSTSAGSGRIHLYSGGSGSAASHFDATNGGASFAPATSLWPNSAALSAYDQVMLGCDGIQNPGASIPTTALTAMKTYADDGGRVYLAHWNNYWIEAAAAPWNALGSWSNSSDNSISSANATVNATFPQASTLRSWLSLVGASATLGTLPITNFRHTLLSVDETAARKWIYLAAIPGSATPSVQYFSFDAPVENAADLQRGRVIFADIHASTGDTSANALAFPSGGCGTSVTALAPQDKALIYAAFDLQRCVGSTGE